jgi:hypothetical protein
MNCNHVYRLVSQVYISWWAYVFIRPESLGVKGQEPVVELMVKEVTIWYQNQVTTMSLDGPC